MFKPSIHDVHVTGIGTTIHTLGVRNEREATEFVFARPPKNNSLNVEEKERFYTELLLELRKRNGKYYLRIRKSDILIFEKALEKLESGAYLENKLRTLRLSVIPLNLETKSTTIEGYQFQRESDLNVSQAISKFQMEHLSTMRSLSLQAIEEKFGTRYNLQAIKAKLKETQRVAIFTARDKDRNIVATFVATAHFCLTTDRKPQKTIYLSDLMLISSVINNKEFLSCFIQYVSRAIHQVFPLAKTATFMSPGSDEDSLVRCVRTLGEQGLREPLNPSSTKLYPYFVSDAPSSVAPTLAPRPK